MTYGDPKDMTDQVRSDGHEGVKETMAEHVREHHVASGSIADSRRLVAFVYLVLRDNMVCGRVGEVMRMYRTGLPPSQLRRAILEFDTLAERLTSTVPLVTMRAWLAHLHLQSTQPEQLKQLAALLPEADDTETLFTNGWLAQYAQYIVAELEQHGQGA